MKQVQNQEKNKFFHLTFLKYGNLAALAGILLFAAAMWVSQRSVPFMLDDFWYSTNLATGEPLKGLADIVESQVWHFFNWGGRCMTHGILQMVLMQGEMAADILNMIILFLLGFLICLITGNEQYASQTALMPGNEQYASRSSLLSSSRNPFWLLFTLSLIVALNPNIQMSMLWQSGTVNYVYSSAWILLFLWPYFRCLENPEKNDLPLAALWVIPLGILTGWSNENMGPACFVVITAEILYLRKKRKRPARLWMIGGAITCLAGSIMVVIAPGNFVRNAAIEKKALGYMIYDRFYSMLRAGVDFLFPSFLLLIAVILIWIAGCKGRLRPGQWMMLALAVLSYGAMVLSPHYPDRATFGTMVVCIMLTISLLKDILVRKEKLKSYLLGAAFSYWCYAIFVLIGGLN